MNFFGKTPIICWTRITSFFLIARQDGAAAFILLFTVLASPIAPAENWPQWRGLKGDGHSPEKDIPTAWSPKKNVAWKTPIPGEGHSSPVVWEESIFLTAAVKKKTERQLLKLDAKTGKIAWAQTVLSAKIEEMHGENSPASSTPVTDGTSVFTSFQNGERVDLQCFDFSGQRIWSIQPLRFRGMHGYSYTPLIYQDLLIFDCSQQNEPALLGLEKASGNIRWRYNRQRREISHVTPLLVDESGVKQLIICGGGEIRGLDPESGRALWWCEGPSLVSVTGLSYGDGVVFATAGYPKRARLAVKTSGAGEVTQTHVLWSSNREVSYVPSPVYLEGYLYTIVDEGVLHCFDAKTGKAVWSQRLGGRFRSSLVSAEKNIYATSNKGLTTVFRATPDGFKLVSANDLDEFCYATPAIANGRIYLRTGSQLYCIGKGRESAP